MNKRDFLHRNVEFSQEFTDEEGEKFKIVASRARTNTGHASIKVWYGKQCMEFSGEAYELHASLVADLIYEICKEPCLLPSLPQKDSK